jgi:glycosyltransferase involved in cell wall biosynthesis
MSLHSSSHIRVGIVSGILHPKYGGPVSVIQSHVKGLSPYADIHIFGVAAADELRGVHELFPQAHISPKAFPERWFRGRGLLKALNEAAANLDVIHAHMLWDYPVLCSWLVSRQANKPIIISPHGTLLEPWRYQTPHKRIYLHLIFKNIANHTSCIPVLNEAEASACRKLGIKCPIRVIPNGLPAEDFDLTIPPKLAYEQWPMLKDHSGLLYLGRLSPEKRLDLLIRVWAKVTKYPKRKDWLLVLAGSGHREYKEQLLKLINSLGLDKNILMTGFVGGDLKKSLFSASTCFVMPSLSEGFSMAILEAMAARLPAIYTAKCNFPELAAHDGGWEIGMEESDLSDALQEVVSQEPKCLAEAVKRANYLGKQNYNLEKIAIDILEMYNDVI